MVTALLRPERTRYTSSGTISVYVLPLNLQLTHASATQSPGLRHTHGAPGAGAGGAGGPGGGGGGGGGIGGGRQRSGFVQRFEYAVQSPLGTAESFSSCE